MNSFAAQLFLVIGTTLTGIGAMGSSMHDWNEVKSVSFVFGAAAVIGSAITGVFVRPPTK